MKINMRVQKKMQTRKRRWKCTRTNLYKGRCNGSLCKGRYKYTRENANAQEQIYAKVDVMAVCVKADVIAV